MISKAHRDIDLFRASEREETEIVSKEIERESFERERERASECVVYVSACVCVGVWQMVNDPKRDRNRCY